MQIAEIGLQKLVALICDDTRKYRYRTKQDLVSLFYGNLIDNKENFDFENNSRKNICLYLLRNVKDYDKLFKEICDSRNFTPKELQNEYIKELNYILSIDNIEIIKNDNNIITLKIIDNIIESSLNNYSILTIEYIEENIKKAKKKISNNDFSGAITNSRTLLEQIIRDLCSELNIEYDDKNLKKGFNTLKNKLNLNPEKYENDSFKKIISGLFSCIDGISEVRNKFSDSHSRIYNPSKHHAKLCVNSVLTLSEFLVESYLYQKERGKI